MILQLIVFFSRERYFLRGLTAGLRVGMTDATTDRTLGAEDLSQLPRGTWTAIAIGTVLAFVASIAPTTAFVDEDGRAGEVHVTLVRIVLASFSSCSSAWCPLRATPSSCCRRCSCCWRRC